MNQNGQNLNTYIYVDFFFPYMKLKFCLKFTTYQSTNYRSSFKFKFWNSKNFRSNVVPHVIINNRQNSSKQMKIYFSHHCVHLQQINLYFFYVFWKERFLLCIEDISNICCISTLTVSLLNYNIHVS